jgi:hypothetical protein
MHQVHHSYPIPPHSFTFFTATSSQKEPKFKIPSSIQASGTSHPIPFVFFHLPECRKAGFGDIIHFSLQPHPHKRIFPSTSTATRRNFFDGRKKVLGGLAILRMRRGKRRWGFEVRRDLSSGEN